MFTSRYSQKKYNQKKPFWQRPLYILIGLPLSIIGLELLTRLVLSVAGKSAELESYDGNTPIVRAYNLRFEDDNKHPLDGLSDQGKLIAKRNLSLGYQLAPSQKNDYLQINAQSFREDKGVDKNKPDDEIRIFVLGGSASFGQMSLNNQTTFAHKLESRLNQRVDDQKKNPDRYRPVPLPVYYPEKVKALALPPQIKPVKYRVINASVPGYSSGNELSRLATEVLAYNPDIVIVVNGYADLILPSKYQGTDIPEINTFLTDAPGHFWTFLSRKTVNFIGQSYLVKCVNYWIIRPQKTIAQKTVGTNDPKITMAEFLTNNTGELQKRVKRYENNLLLMAKLTAPNNIPLIIAVQPEITSRSVPSTQEKDILNQLGTTYQQRIKNGYTEIAKSTEQVKKDFGENVTALNFYPLYDKFPGIAFQDAINLTDEAHTVLADQLFKNVIELDKLSLAKKKKLPTEDNN